MSSCIPKEIKPVRERVHWVLQYFILDPHLPAANYKTEKYGLTITQRLRVGMRRMYRQEHTGQGSITIHQFR